MEFSIFLKSLLRYKYILIGLPIIIGTLTYFLVRDLPNTYKSSARIATGLVERSDEYINGQTNIPESKIAQEFSNIVQMMMLKKIVNQVSYQLMLHDLSGKETPYRKQSKLLINLSPEDKKAASKIFEQKYNAKEDLFPGNKNEKLLQELLVSMKYDYKSLTKKLNIYRLQTSDYIHLEYESENPVLSALVLNLLCKESINYYTASINQNKEKALNYLDSVILAKETSLNAKMQALKSYKIKNRVLNVNDQASVLMGQIADFQSRRQEAEKNISAYSGALRNIDSKLDPTERKNVESSLTEANQDILSTRNRLNGLNDEYIKSNFDAKYKLKIDSLQNALTNHINQANDRTTYNTATAKQDLVKEKMNLEVNLEIAKNSVASLNQEVNNLTGKLNVLAPNQANIQSFEKDIENQSRELYDLVNKSSQTRLESSFPIRLRQVETAMPEAPEPSKKILFILLAAVTSFMFCICVLFFLFYIDHSVNDTKQLGDRTHQPIIGLLDLMPGVSLDPKEVWNRNDELNTYKNFKSQLRSIRFEIDNATNHSKIVAITSLLPNAGKTFVALHLAHAYKMINKRVLLIDGNFETPQVSEAGEAGLFLEDFLVSDNNLIPDNIGNELLIMGNKGEDVSLMELSHHDQIESKLKSLHERFDIILIEVPSLSEFNKAREWISFSNKVVAVFGAGQNIDDKNKKEVEYLKSIDQKLIGWVLNKVTGKRRKYTAKNTQKKTYV